MSQAPLRSIPSVHTLMETPELREATARLGRAVVLEAARTTIDQTRSSIASGETCATDLAKLAAMVEQRLRSERSGLRRVVNATGILLHTGLGRAPLAQEAVESIARVALGYCNLELDLETNERGRRESVVAGLLRRLSGAAAAIVVNNNAAATVLVLRALAQGREVIVSRGQLVEIGGSFRLPEILEASGARLREVGTTNKTRLSDYERAIGPETAAIMLVHPSNYRIVGFTESVEIAQISSLARSRGLWSIDDIGSGAIAHGMPPRVVDEPTARASLEAGADVVLFSGDKLLGGPQCGVVLGGTEPIGKLASDPLMRAMRVDKLTLSALEATLRLALDPDLGSSRIPLWRFLACDLDALLHRATQLAGRMRETQGVDASAVASEALLGGGSWPERPLPSWAVVVGVGAASTRSVAELARRLRSGEPAVLGRIRDDALWLDLRAVDPPEDEAIVAALGRALTDR